MKTYPLSFLNWSGSGAIIRRRDGRHMRYFMNPNVATHLGQKARESAQAKAPQLRLV